MNIFKKAPKLRFKEFKNDWSVDKLGILADVRDGTHDSPKYIDSGFPLITSKNLLSDGSIDFENVNYISDFDYSKINTRSNVDEGDILFGMIGTIGNPVLVDCCDFAIKNVALIKQKVGLLNVFTYQYFKSPYIDKQFYQKNAGGTQKFIALGVIRDLEINIPSLPEQQKIADFLSLVDAWIANLKKQKELLESYKKAMMQKIFAREIRFKDEDGNDFPDWVEKRLGEVFLGLKGTGLSKNELNERGVNYCILYGELYTKYKVQISDIYSRTNVTEGFISKSGDLLIPCSTTTTGLDLSNVTFLPKSNVMLGGDITILRSRIKTDSLFYAYYLTNFKKHEIARYSQGVTIIHLYFSHFKNMIIDVPSYDEQLKISSLLENIDDLILLIEKKSSIFKIWKKGLMQRMFI